MLISAHTPISINISLIEEFHSFIMRKFAIVIYLYIVGQLSTRKLHYCAVFVKNMRFGIEYKQSISIYSDMPHIRDSRWLP